MESQRIKHTIHTAVDECVSEHVATLTFLLKRVAYCYQSFFFLLIHVQASYDLIVFE
jgi:hypothetical protein